MKVEIPLQGDSAAKPGRGPGKIRLALHGTTVVMTVVGFDIDERTIEVSASWLTRTLNLLEACRLD